MKSVSLKTAAINGLCMGEITFGALVVFSVILYGVTYGFYPDTTALHPYIVDGEIYHRAWWICMLLTMLVPIIFARYSKPKFLIISAATGFFMLTCLEALVFHLPYLGYFLFACDMLERPDRTIFADLLIYNMPTGATVVGSAIGTGIAGIIHAVMNRTKTHNL